MCPRYALTLLLTTAAVQAVHVARNGFLIAESASREPTALESVRDVLSTSFVMSEITDTFGMIGETLDGQCVIEELVAECVPTLVYKGRCGSLDAPVAIECLNPPETLDATARASLVRNFRESCHLHYRLSQGDLHIARSLASGIATSPTLGVSVPYLVREWLDGHSLATDFAKRRAQGMPGRRLVEVMALLESAANALAYAHEHGVVHGDVHPGHLFLATTSDGTTLKVMSFGLAGLPRDPAYAAPEHLDEAAGPVGPWTDVYGLAVVMLEALGDTPLPAEVELLFTRALAHDPRMRPRDAAELWTALKNATRRATEARMHGMIPLDESRDDIPTVPPPPPIEQAQTIAPEAPRPPLVTLSRRQRVMWGLAAATAIALTGNGVSHALRAKKPPPPLQLASPVAPATPPASPVEVPPLVPPPPPLEEVEAAAAAAAAAASVAQAPQRARGGRVKEVPPVKDSPFPQRAAFSSLDSLGRILASCCSSSGHEYRGEARVTFGTDGRVIRIAIDPPLAGTRMGDCVAHRFSVARVPPYRGSPQTVRYAFQIPK